MINKLLPQLSIVVDKPDRYTPVHIFLGAVAGFVFGFNVPLVLGSWYEISQSYMVREGTSQTEGLNLVEKALFASNRRSSLTDFFADVIGGMLGASARVALGLGGFY
jgi:hypothetical protein